MLDLFSKIFETSINDIMIIIKMKNIDIKLFPLVLFHKHQK